ncbi:MAG: hypothetical protein ACOH1R_08505 [Luteimonas sp.]
MTLSEELFAEFCRRAQIRCERIPTEAGRTPDYDIFLGDLLVVAEVKEVDPPPRGPTGVYSFTIGKAIRHDLKKAGRQIKARAQDAAPGMVVLFEEQWQQVGAAQIRHAMYGAHTVDLHVPTDRSEAPRFIGHRLGGQRQTTEEHNTSISAVAHLDREGVDGLTLTVYHNRYARLPIERERFARYGIRQFELPEVEGYGIPDWTEVGIEPGSAGIPDTPD